MASQLLRLSPAVGKRAEVHNEAPGYAIVLALERHEAVVIIWIVGWLASASCFRSLQRENERLLIQGML